MVIKSNQSQKNLLLAKLVKEASAAHNRTGVFIVFVNQGVFHTTLGKTALINGTDYIIRM